MQSSYSTKLEGSIQNGCVMGMAVSKRAKARFKIMSQAEKSAVKKAVKLLYDTELMGVKRMREIMRLAEK